MITEQLAKLVATTVKDLYDLEITPNIEVTDEQFGDFTTNIAMQLAKQLKKAPRKVAEGLVEPLKAHSDLLSDVSMAGPGFLNMKLTDEALWDAAKAKPAQPLKGKTVVAEYSDPNPFKVLHAGHLYTTITGDVVANLLELAGAKVHRVNFGGDVGLHVGSAMWAILEELGGEHPEKLKDVPEKTRLEWVSAQYVKGNTAYGEDEAAKEAIISLNKKVYQLHEDNDHESKFAQIYWTCHQWSYDGFDKLYKDLNVAPFEKYYPESETTDVGITTVKNGLAKGIFEASDGAVVYRGEKDGLHTRVFLTKAKLPTYEAKDLGLAVAKWEDYHFDHSVIITGNDIIEYMKVVLAALSHFHPEIAARSTHLTHGMIRLAGNAKMSSRTGNILRAVDVLVAATLANEELTKKDQPDVVLAAVKYAFLKQRIGGDIIYDPAESVSLTGNSGPYLQYAHARARSILAKSDKKAAVAKDLQPDERSLLRQLSSYNLVLTEAMADLLPHRICTYLYETCQVFNRFYENNKVVGDGREAVRLALVERYADTLKDGLSLLGIAAPDRI